MIACARITPGGAMTRALLPEDSTRRGRPCHAIIGRMKNTDVFVTISLSALLWAASPGVLEAQTVRRIQPPTAAIAVAVWNGDTLYVSGQLPDPVTPADTAKGTPAVYSADTRSQAESVFKKIAAILKEQGLGLGDIVMMHVYLAGDPKMGNKMDFAGMMAAYTQFFGTPAQPNKPARSTVQVAGLVAPGALVEIDVVAVRGK
jgi:enamine deaminase RidA (YjgF/YER057c/UK114 family)